MSVTEAGAQLHDGGGMPVREKSLFATSGVDDQESDANSVACRLRNLPTFFGGEEAGN